MSIKIGLFLSNQFPHEADPQIGLQEVISQVRSARQNGFDSLWAAQHYLTRPFKSFQPGPLLARLIPEVEGMMIGPNVLPLPLLNPVRVAEEAVTMDYLTEGRYVLGVGLGYRDEEYQVFNIEKSTRVARFKEAVEVIRRLWAEEIVNHSGTHYKLPGVGLGTPPLQPKGPPIWIGASVDPAIKRAAQIGDAWLITFYPSISWLRQQMDLYHTARRDVGKEPAEELPILRECYVGKDFDSAVTEAQKSIERPKASEAVTRGQIDYQIPVRMYSEAAIRLPYSGTYIIRFARSW